VDPPGHSAGCERPTSDNDDRSDTLRKPHGVRTTAISNGEQVHRVAGLAMVAKRSVDFCGYWQRHAT